MFCGVFFLYYHHSYLLSLVCASFLLLFAVVVREVEWVWRLGVTGTNWRKKKHSQKYRKKK